MKNILNYYYGIIVDNIDNNGYFSYNNHLFCLYLYKRNIDEINSLTILNNYMLLRGIHVNKIINNNMGSTLTFYENNYYCLLLIKYEYNKGYFNFIIAPTDRRLDILKRNDWAYLWSIKIDYIEYQNKHIENVYPLLNESANYYLGMAENAISYFKMIILDNENLYINHRRITKMDLYNPLELVIDYKVRDVSEYIKECFVNGEKTIYEIKKFVNNLNLSNMDYVLLYDRLLFPSFYFDVYENIINNSLSINGIKEIINLTSDYEELLYEIYNLIKRKTNILGIDWINVKFM